MKSPADKIRIDKWLWAVRIFKTRTLAAAACDKGKVTIQSQPVKASRLVQAGTIIAVRNGAFTLHYEVLQPAGNRLSATLAQTCCRNVTDEAVLRSMQLHAAEMQLLHSRGEGRPTKRDRRALDDLLNEQDE
ncbi:MAG: RNA-binding S4 domain-containing protein [Chitinophagales bacterium]|nr:RNA-binding S4 domain-containing protein [Chitinophagales bacterium]